MAKPEPVKLPQDLMAVALDTNSTSGDLSLPRLRELSNLLDEQEIEDAEIWVPEPVLWEWAEHAHKKLKSVELTAGQLAKTGLAGLGLQLEMPVASVNGVVRSIEEELRRIGRLRILRLADDPDAAIEGLRDQVLQTGAGRLKAAERTKTGAADSASFRLVENAAEGSLEDLVVLVSADKDVKAHYEGGSSPIVIHEWGLMMRSVVAMAPSDSEVEAQAVEAITTYLRRFLANTGERIEYGELDGDIDRAVSRHEIHEHQRNVGVWHLDRIGPTETVDVSRRAGYAAVEIDVTLTLFSETAWYDAGSESTEQDDEVFRDVPAVVSVWADRNGGEWDVRIETLYVLKEGSEEAHRVGLAVYGIESYD